MQLPSLIPGTLIRRYKRFLADVRLADGREVTAHCPNTGSMLGCAEPGFPVWLSDSGNPKRKYPLGWELVEPCPGIRVGIHTGRANGLVAEAIEAGRVPELQGYRRLRREVRYGQENSRIDLLLSEGDGPDCYVEVKNVTAAVEEGVALFPDARSERASKHLRELMHVVHEGGRAVVFFCVQRADVGEVRPADTIDPEYGRTLRQAMDNGVLALAWSAAPGLDSIELSRALPVVCP